MSITNKPRNYFVVFKTFTIWARHQFVFTNVSTAGRFANRFFPMILILIIPETRAFDEKMVRWHVIMKITSKRAGCLGKTTTWYALMREIKDASKKIIDQIVRYKAS